VLATAAQRANLMQRFGMDQITDSLLRQDLTLSVSVGMGATDPTQRRESFLSALAAYNQIATAGSPDQNLPEIRKVLFGLSGFRDSARFFLTEVNPQVVKAEKMMQSAEEMARKYVDQQKDALIRKEVQLDDRETDLEVKELELLTERKLFDIEKSATENDADIKKSNIDNMITIVKSERDAALKGRSVMLDMALKEDKAAQEMLIKALDAKLEMLIKKQAADQERMLKAVAAPKEKRGKKDPKTGEWVVTERTVN